MFRSDQIYESGGIPQEKERNKTLQTALSVTFLNNTANKALHVQYKFLLN